MKNQNILIYTAITIIIISVAITIAIVLYHKHRNTNKQNFSTSYKAVPEKIDRKDKPLDINYGFNPSNASKTLSVAGTAPSIDYPDFDVPDNFWWGDVDMHSFYPSLLGNYLVSVRNQHNPQQYCGSCFVFSSVQTLGDRFNILNTLKTGKRMEDAVLSPQQILNCIFGPDGEHMTCLTGGDSHIVYEYILKNGIVHETCKPYTSQAIHQQCEPSCYTCMPPGLQCSDMLLTPLSSDFTKITPDCCKICKNKPDGKDQYGNDCKYCNCDAKTGDYNFGITYGAMPGVTDTPQIGVCCEIKDPTKYEIEGYANITKRYTLSSKTKNANNYIKYIQQEIYMNGPVTVAIDAGQAEKYKSSDDIISSKGNIKCKYSGLDHLVAITGWGIKNGIKYWIIRNSWGTGYGKGGYVWMEMGTECCGLERMDNYVYAAYPKGWKDYGKYKVNENLKVAYNPNTANVRRAQRM